MKNQLKKTILIPLCLFLMITVKSQDYIVFKSDASMRPQVYINIQRDFVSYKSTEVATEKASRLSEILEVGLDDKTFIIILIDEQYFPMERITAYGKIKLFEYDKQLYIQHKKNTIRKLGKDNYRKIIGEFTDADLSRLKLGKFGLAYVIDQINADQTINVENIELTIGLDIRKTTYLIKKRAFPTNPSDFELDNNSIGVNFGIQRIFKKHNSFSHKINTALIKNTFERTLTNFFSVATEEGVIDLVARDELLSFSHLNASLDYGVYFNHKLKDLTFLLGASVQTNFFLFQDNKYSETLLNGQTQDRSYFVDTPVAMPGYIIEAGLKYYFLDQYFMQLSFLANESYSEDYSQKTKGIRLCFGF